MKKEKEQRQGGAGRPAARISQVAQVAKPPVVTAAAVVGSSPLPNRPDLDRPHAPASSASSASSGGGLLNGYGGDSDDEQEAAETAEPSVKRARLEEAAMPSPAVSSRATPGLSPVDNSVADAAAMPPPASLPSRFRKRADDIAVMEDSGEALLALPAAAPIEAAQVEEEAEPDAEAPESEGLPAGFFDDPERDAKARGIEAPALRQQRELEEGLKRFAREMATTQEEAEETRHELDEQKYEEAAAEEQEFQSDLDVRLAKLRERAASRRHAEKVTAATLASGAPAPIDNIEDAANSDDDDAAEIEFDWRAKGFT